MLRLLCVVSFLLMTVGAQARADAPASKSRRIEYQIGADHFEGLFVQPFASRRKVPGVLMVPNWLGITEETERQATRMARQGLAVFAVDVYGKGVRPKGASEAMPLAGKYKGDRKLFRERLRRGLEVLLAQKEVDAKRIVVVGYCFGGTGAIELARDGADVQAVVSFHGGLDSPNPADGKNIKAKVVVFHGADDPFVKPADVQAFQAEMRQYGVDWRMTEFGGAVHSFTDMGAGHDNKTGAAYNERADQRSFSAFLGLLDELYPSRR
jgi:dienelactone hydrolase